MEDAVLEKCSLFRGVSTKEIRQVLEAVPGRIQCYDKGETVFRLMDTASRIGIILEGAVQAQKSFPGGSQINVTTWVPGDMIGPAAVFSQTHRYPCDLVALEPSTILMFRKEEMLSLMQKDIRVLENFTAGIATATFMLQQRLELLSYSGIAQKAAFYLLIRVRSAGQNRIRIPESVSNWAMIMNVSRSSLHRELKKLETRGIIIYAPPVIEILDQIALEEVLSS